MQSTASSASIVVAVVAGEQVENLVAGTANESSGTRPGARHATCRALNFWPTPP